MSELKATPGPWLDNLHAGEKRDGGRFYVHVLAKAAGIVPIACVPTGVEGHGREEGRANARLIAASPTMAAYIQRKADEGDEEAARIMEAVHAGS